MLRVVATLAATLLLSSCVDDPAPRLPAVVTAVSEQQDAEVRAAVNARETPFVLVDDAALDEWLALLPSSVAEVFDVARPDFTTHVAVVGSFPRCTEESLLAHVGDGRLTYDIIDPEPNTNCAWSPLLLELHVVALDDLGVDDGAHVTVERI